MLLQQGLTASSALETQVTTKSLPGKDSQLILARGGVRLVGVLEESGAIRDAEGQRRCRGQHTVLIRREGLLLILSLVLEFTCQRRYDVGVRSTLNRSGYHSTEGPTSNVS